MAWLTIKFSPSAPASEDSTSDSPPDFERLADLLEQCAWWRGKPSPARSWRRRCEKGGWTSVLSGLAISETYPSTNFRRSTGSPAATLASPGAQQGSDWGKRTLVICGPSSSTRSELFDLEGSSSRTSAATSRSASIASFRTWKDAASAARSDSLRRRKSARLTDANGSSFSAWPTATEIHAIRGNHDEPIEKFEARVRDYEEGRAKGKPGKSLGVAVRLCPTATVGDSRNAANCTANRTKTGHHSGTTLIDAIRIWPTPRTPTGGSESAERKKELGRTRSGGGDLQSEVRNWPTANARDWKGTYRTLRRKDGKMRGDLLPDAVNIEEGGVESSSPPTATETTKAGNSSALAASITSNAEALDPPRTASSSRRPTGSSTVAGCSSGLDGPDKSSTKENRRAQLNPDWVDLLMGYPIGWTDCARSGTP